jgi:DNA-binding transcriptional ArsR family regulator
MAMDREINDLALMKLLMDPRRIRILEVAEEVPMTVGQIAEQLGELPSRVYYHVHKLEEAGLLELVETRQQGNLIEKYYQCKEPHVEFKLNSGFLSQNLSAVRQEVEKVLTAGLQLLEYKVARGQESTHTEQDGKTDAAWMPRVRMKAGWEPMSEWEWSDKFSKMFHNEDHPVTHQGPIRPESPGSSDKPNESKTEYAFIVLSYSVEDARKLGFYTPIDEEIDED